MMSNFKVKKIQRYKPHMTIRLRKEIMKRSCFENKPSDRSNETNFINYQRKERIH